MKKLLVPVDFTEASQNAMSHALSLAKVMGASVLALHVVENKDDAQPKHAKLNEMCAELSQTHGIEVKGIIRVGNIFEDIGDAAAEVDANLIIMGTHGLKGMQYLMGSNALRVITHGSVPFIVVQKDSGHYEFNEIVLPIDITSETKQKIQFARQMADLFGSGVHIVYQKQTDEFNRAKLAQNLKFTKDYLEEHNIRYDTKECTDGSFASGVISYAEEINADLITIMNLSEDHLVDLFGRSYEQVIITNKPQIPVMVVNRKNIGSFQMSFGMG